MSLAKFAVMFFLISLLVPKQVFANTFQAEVLEVLNTYSLKIDTEEGEKVVRIAEIITPKAIFGTFPCEKEAIAYLREMTYGKTMTFIYWATDAAGRSVCEVLLPDGSSVGTLMVASGYALQDLYYSSSADLKFLQVSARKNSLGLWRQVDQDIEVNELFAIASTRLDY